MTQPGSDASQSGSSLPPQVSDAGSESSSHEGEQRTEPRQEALEFMLRRMRHRGDFPALSSSVVAINRITASESESVSKLSELILRDFSLTNKLLRVVNSVHYRPGGGSISTVSRAVIVLGFDAVRNIAITVLLFEHLQDKANAAQLKEEFLRACLAGLRISDALRPGVARLSTGAWFDPTNWRATGAGNLEKHGNPNALTPDMGASRLSQGCIAQTCLVQIEACVDPVEPTPYQLPVLHEPSGGP